MASPWLVDLDPTGAALTVVVVAAGLRAFRADAVRHTVRRRASFSLGLVSLVVAWSSPLSALGRQDLLTAHAAQIAITTGIAPPLLWLGLRDRARLSGFARRHRYLFHPLTGVFVLNVLLLVWHAGGVFTASLDFPPLCTVFDAAVFAGAMLFWRGIVAPFDDPLDVTIPERLLGLIIGMLPLTFTGLAIALSRHLLWTGYAAAPRVWGISALTDQQIAGAFLAVVTKFALGIAFCTLFWQLLSGEDDEPGGGDDRRDGHPAPVVPPRHGTPATTVPAAPETAAPRGPITVRIHVAAPDESAAPTTVPGATPEPLVPLKR